MKLYWDPHENETEIATKNIVFPMVKAYFINIGSMVAGVIVQKFLQTYLPKYHSVTKLKVMGPILGVSVLLIGGISGIILIDAQDYFTKWEVWLAAIMQPLIGCFLGVSSGYIFGFIFQKIGVFNQKKNETFHQELISLGLVVACQNPQYALGHAVNNSLIQAAHVYPIVYAICQILELVLAVFLKISYDFVCTCWIKREVKEDFRGYSKFGDYVERNISFYRTPDREVFQNRNGVFGLQENTIDASTGEVVREKVKKTLSDSFGRSENLGRSDKNDSRVENEKVTGLSFAKIDEEISGFTIFSSNQLPKCLETSFEVNPTARKDSIELSEGTSKFKKVLRATVSDSNNRVNIKNISFTRRISVIDGAHRKYTITSLQETNLPDSVVLDW